MGVVADIEDAFAAHWSLFGTWPKGELHDEDGVLWFETPIAHLPYNGVIRTRIEGDADDAVRKLVARLRGRGVQFFWLVHPSARPADLGERLTAAGVPAVETARGIGKGYVSFAGPPGVAALFAMSVLPAARGRGVAGGSSVHSSDMARGVYRRIGFVEQCRLPFHATTAIWSSGH